MRLGNRVTVQAVLIACCSVVSSLPAQASANTATCPNEELRSGPSTALPSCRAYELVTPSDSNGRLVGPLHTYGLPTDPEVLPYELASPAGDSVVFLAYQGALPELPPGTGVADTFEAIRGSSGWGDLRRLSPSGAETNKVLPGGISTDHLYSLSVSTDTASPLTINNRATPYLRGPDGSFQLIGLGSVEGVPAVEPYAQARYISPRGEHVVFSTGNVLGQSAWCSASPPCKPQRLDGDAPPDGTGAIYDRPADGLAHVVSLLPGDVPQGSGQQAFYKGCSRNARSVAFLIEGTLYARINNGDGGEEATLKVVEGNPTYAGLSDDGRYLFYVTGGESGTIHRFDTTTEDDVEINPGNPGEVVNISADGSHVYFIAEAPIGGEGELGEPNLFVWRSGAIAYVATVASSDLDHTSGSASGIPALTNWTKFVASKPASLEQGPGADSSRSTPDGKVLVFESKAKLTTYDNASHTEIYRYDDETHGLVCPSCNYAGGSATHDARLQATARVNNPTVIHNVTDDGSRVFFETAESLTSRDVDQVNDIYEWHQEEDGASVGLISSGESTEYLTPEPFAGPPPNILLSVTPSGNDVVFLAQDALVEGTPEGGALAIYDARIGGGFPITSPPEPCQEESCRLSGPPAPDLSLHRRQANPAGNVRHRKHRCRRPSKKKSHRARCSRRKPSRNGSASESTSTSGAPVSAVTSTSEAPAIPGAVSDDPTPPTRAPHGAAGPYDQYGLKEIEATTSTTSAGGHPDFTTRIAFDQSIVEKEATSRMESVTVALPPGLVGNPNAVPRCRTGEFVAFSCPIESQVGIAKVFVTWLDTYIVEPIYNLTPPHPEKEIARFGFSGVQLPIYIDVKVRTAGDYGVTATVYGPSGQVSVVSAQTTFWGNPTDPVHDPQRLLPVPEGLECQATETACEAPGGKREVERSNVAFMANPSACQAGEVTVTTASYQLPGQIFEGHAPLAPVTDCHGLPFAPSLSVEPTSHVAGAPTGLASKLHLPQHLGGTESASATLREARVTLPAGMEIAAGAANWIGTCSARQVGLNEEVDADCPNASKLGTATIVSPELPTPIEGSIYQRNPRPGQQFGLWLTSDALGLHVKLPGELEPDKSTGRLTVVFKDLPQVPVEEIDLNVWGGPRGPLQNPDHCGTYATEFTFSPHSDDPPVTGQSQMQISEGCDRPFAPDLAAGVIDPTAGRFSPLVIDLSRSDGDQALRGLELELPDGELAKLKGVALCPDEAAVSGACSSDSRLGSVTAASGPGPEPLWVPQSGKPAPGVYLAGPYAGWPFSIVTVVPAQAGPFDLGNIVVRSGLGLNPDTNRAVVKADPLPQFFEGVGLTYRRLHVVIDRPNFSLNPTDCSPLHVTSTATSTQGAVAHPTSPFRVDGCKRLKFKPKLSLRLAGGTRRAAYPALTAVLKAGHGVANISKASVSLPHSEFLAQEHIGTICTRKRFAVHKCPRNAIYGRAKAWTPLLAKPLAGPVYLRSSNHPLPDLVVALSGELNVNLVGRIDSKSGGIRTSFEAVPDAPVTKFVLKMRGGKKGLLTNSTDVCQGRHRASVQMQAQNGRSRSLRIPLASTNCSKHRKDLK